MMYRKYEVTFHIEKQFFVQQSVLLGSIGGKGGGIIRLRELFCFAGALRRSGEVF
ncbi:hypothetical protein VSK92_09700 [Bacillus swezeyi]|uniref:hypothetical protein n=1 Tax=Bacillus swezeyi TaxID=1925020 RepID=UPI0039C733EA